MPDHKLKTWPEQYAALLARKKTAEFRKDDRGFQVGDRLSLEEWNPANGEYTGSSMVFKVSHIVRGPDFGVPEGYALLSLEPW